MADSSIKSLLSSDEIESLLVKEKLSGLKIIVKDLRIFLTGATQKQDIIEHLVCMAHIGAVQEDENADFDDACAILYLTDETKQDILELPSFSSVTNWTKNLAYVQLMILILSAIGLTWQITGWIQTNS